ncbi:MAG: hypothetical protein ACT4QC_13975 [Planctomycetaceae bacterium]
MRLGWTTPDEFWRPGRTDQRARIARGACANHYFAPREFGRAAQSGAPHQAGATVERGLAFGNFFHPLFQMRAAFVCAPTLRPCKIEAVATHSDRHGAPNAMPFSRHPASAKLVWQARSGCDTAARAFERLRAPSNDFGHICEGARHRLRAPSHAFDETCGKMSVFQSGGRPDCRAFTGETNPLPNAAR